MFGSGQWTIWEGYAAAKLCKAGLPLQQPRPQRAPLHGLRRGRLHAHLRHRRADGLLRRHRAGRRLRAVGLEHGRDAPDPVDPHHRPAPEQPARQGGGALDVRAPQLRPRRHGDHLQAADRPGDPQLHRPLHHHEQEGRYRVRQEERQLQEGRRRHRLRPAPRRTRWRRTPRPTAIPAPTASPRATRTTPRRSASRSSPSSSATTRSRRRASCRACP